MKYQKKTDFRDRLFSKNDDSKIKLINQLVKIIKYTPVSQQDDKEFFRPYSFITKFCAIATWANKKHTYGYPIYDSLVMETLKDLLSNNSKDSKGFLDILKKDYPNILYGNKISISRLQGPENFNNFYAVTSFLKNYFEVSFRILDTFMWRRGQVIKDSKTKEKH